MKFTQTAVIETQLPPEADVADFVNGDGAKDSLDIMDEALQMTEEAVSIAIETREADTDSPSLDVTDAIADVTPDNDIESQKVDEAIEAFNEVRAAANSDPEFAEIFNNWIDARLKWEDQCQKIRFSHRLKLDDLKSEIVILSKKIEDLRQLTKDAKAEYKQCITDLMDGEKKGPELPKKPECITYERFLELKEQAKDNPDAPPITLTTASQSPNQDEEWKAVATSTIFEGKTIKGLGKKKIEAVCDVAPTLGELEELRNQASLKHLHFCKMLPKGIGEELADAIQDLMYPHTYPNSKGNV